MLPSDAVLEEATLGKIISSGHSRVPIHQPGNRSDSQSSISMLCHAGFVDQTQEQLHTVLLYLCSRGVTINATILSCSVFGKTVSACSYWHSCEWPACFSSIWSEVCQTAIPRTSSRRLCRPVATASPWDSVIQKLILSSRCSTTCSLICLL